MACSGFQIINHLNVKVLEFMCAENYLKAGMVHGRDKMNL